MLTLVEGFPEQIIGTSSIFVGKFPPQKIEQNYKLLSVLYFLLFVNLTLHKPQEALPSKEVFIKNYE